MKKNVELFCVAVACAFCTGFAVADDYTYQALYWQVGDSVKYYGDAVYASLYAVVDGNRINYQQDAEELSTMAEKGGARSEFVGGTMGGWDWGSSDIQSATFYVELWSEFTTETPSVLATSYGESYESLTSFMERNSSGAPDPTLHFSNYSFSFAIPEPTSGVLFLIGVAGLALKRKRLS